MMRLNLRIKSLSTQLNSLPHFTSSFNNINHKRTLSHQNQTFKFKSIKPFSRSQSTTQSVTENLKEISRSAKHESGKTMGSVINAMSAGKSSPQTQSGLSDSSLEVVSDLKGIGNLFQAVPRGALLFGSAGLVPYLATSVTTIYLAKQVYNSENGLGSKFDSETALTLLYHNEGLQVAYGAVILSFLGAIHWGIEFASDGMKVSHLGGPKGIPRYLLGTLPVLLAWPTLLLPGQLALASQWAAFTLVWYADMIATGKGWTPVWYSTYRFGLTAIVGTTIIITLVSTNYWAIDEVGYRSTLHKLQSIRQREKDEELKADDGSEARGGIKVKGQIPKTGTVMSRSGEDSYVIIEEVERTVNSKQHKRNDQQK